MQEIAAASLTHLPTRIAYLKSFQGFTDADGALIKSTAPVVSPLVPALLDGVYSKLLTYTITAKAFAPVQSGQSGGEKCPAGAAGAGRVQDLSLEHGNIVYRKESLRGYLVRLVTNDDWSDSSDFWDYLDKVGSLHTGKPELQRASRRPDLRVEYAHLGMLLGFVEDQIVAVVMAIDGLDLETKGSIVRAFNKLLWIQNDLFARHYVVDKDSGYAPQGLAVTNAAASNVRILLAGLIGMLIGAWLVYAPSP
ncbi:MAG: hypothetical protein M1825_006402 [Sarcosagium campestre]|nr:MAG: hypothetical protein M1825_006402 [Sarcosagium campestre]